MYTQFRKISALTILCLSLSLTTAPGFAGKVQFKRSKPHANVGTINVPANTSNASGMSKIKPRPTTQKSWLTVCLEDAKAQGESDAEALELCGVITVPDSPN